MLRTFGVHVGSVPGNPVMEVPRSEIERREQLFPLELEAARPAAGVFEVPKRTGQRAYLR